MRQITEEAIECFDNRESFKKDNTEVIVSGQVIELRLFGNMIARKTGEKVEVTTAGWDTVTTRERLNGLRGVDVHRSRGTLFLNGSEWDGELVEVDCG
tara:strand:+ start:126 stop:419 length:294 start_codon:yes stop_codon:yes gene_type:complete